MRIISEFKDYYDHAMSFGQDPAIVYMRKFESFRIWSDKGFSYDPQVTPWLKSSKLEKLLRGLRGFHAVNDKIPSDRAYLGAGYLVVAGVLYPVILPYASHRGDSGILLYSMEDVDNYLDQHVPGATFFESARDYFKKFLDFKVISGYDGTFESVDKNYLMEECLENNLPNLLVSGSFSAYGTSEGYIKKDICLKKAGFASVVESTQVYQELEMFLGLVKTRQPMPVPDNKVKIEGHGFDLKQSFRHRQ